MKTENLSVFIRFFLMKMKYNFQFACEQINLNQFSSNTVFLSSLFVVKNQNEMKNLNQRRNCIYPQATYRTKTE